MPTGSNSYARGAQSLGALYGRSVSFVACRSCRVRWAPATPAPRAWLLYVPLGAPLSLPPSRLAPADTALPSFPLRSRARPSLHAPVRLPSSLRAPNNITPTGSQPTRALAPYSLRSLRQRCSGGRGRYFCGGRAGSSYLAACPPFAGDRSRSACPDPPCGRDGAGRARPLSIARLTRSSRAGLGLLVDGGSSAPEPPRLATLGATALCVPLRARLRPRRYRLRNAPSPCRV